MVNYSPELVEKICNEIATGRSLARVCAEEDWMPEEKTVYNWMFSKPGFLELYDKAKEKQMEVYANQIIDLSDMCIADADAVAKTKLQIFARQWVMGKLKPKKYGDRTIIAGDKDNPLTLNVASALDNRIAAARGAPTIEHQPAASAAALPVIDAESVDSE